ncbi:hypothetical protein B0H10DRAFT_2114973 [Mycena sp. CBHHK59/15]|nr:hypothetical protein B0H10DRAFT_2114973 [Mycena sp. CBHHK59/15]
MPNASELAIGPIFIGFFFNVLLYGVMLSQIYIYFTMFYCDKAWLKTFVLVILALDTLNTAFDFAYLYRVLISNFGNTSVLARADWIFATDPVLTALIACCVQLFYAWRVQLLSRKLWLVILVVVCALAGLAGGLATTIEVVKLPHFKDFQYFKAAVIVWLAAECVADILITTILVKHLKSHKTGFKGSDILIDQVIRLTIQTGLLTSLCATVDLILYLADPVALHLIFNIPLCKLYSNSLMSSLNSRREWATGAANDSGIFSQIILVRVLYVLVPL